MRKASSYYKEDDTFNIIQKARKENYNRLSVNYMDDNIQKELNNSEISKAILSELVSFERFFLVTQFLMIDSMYL